MKKHITANVEIAIEGPLFTFVADEQIGHFIDETLQAVADRAVKDVTALGMSQYKNSTGAYVSNVSAEWVSPKESRAHDDNSLYGPWLEGIGTRNAPVTKFAGYRTWRMTTAALAHKVPGIAAQVLRKYLPRMN